MPTNTPTPTPEAAQPVRASGSPEPTPIRTEIVAVTPVAGATPVQPDDRIRLSEGNVSVSLVPVSRARTYQAALSVADETARADALSRFSVSLYSAEGEYEKDPRLISPARITVNLDADSVSELGGAAVLLQTRALGGVSLLSVSEVESDEWSGNQFALDIEPDGSAVVSAETRRIVGSWALSLDAETVALAKAQLSGQPVEAPTATPIPTLTPAPTPVPTQTPTTLALPPDTGEGPTPLWIMTLAAAAILTALAGARVISSARRRVSGSG